MSHQGTADVQGTVAIRVWHGATDCPAPADRDAGTPPDFRTDQPVDAGAFLASVGGELGREGRFVVCGYLDQPGAATMDAAQTKAEGPSGFGTLLLKARVTFKLTAPLQRTHSALVTFGNDGTIRFSCATSMRKNECTDGAYGKFLTGDGIDR